MQLLSVAHFQSSLLGGFAVAGNGSRGQFTMNDFLRNPHFSEKLFFVVKLFWFNYLKSKRIWQISLFNLQIWALHAPVPCDVDESKYVQFSDDEPPQVSVTENDKSIKKLCSIISRNILLIRHVKSQNPSSIYS